MRTTLNLDEDVLGRARRVAARLKLPFREVINESLRGGLSIIEKPRPCRPYRTRAHSMGLKAGRNLDNIQELLAHVDGEDCR